MNCPKKRKTWKDWKRGRERVGGEINTLWERNKRKREFSECLFFIWLVLILSSSLKTASFICSLISLFIILITCNFFDCFVIIIMFIFQRYYRLFFSMFFLTSTTTPISFALYFAGYQTIFIFQFFFFTSGKWFFNGVSSYIGLLKFYSQFIC